MAQEARGGMVFHKKRTPAMVSRELILLEKRFFLSQAIIPTATRGGGRSGLGFYLPMS